MRVFVSYSPDDNDLKNKLLTHLSPSRRDGVLSHWDPSEVKPGDEPRSVIEAELERSDVALVLLSASYLAAGGPGERHLLLIEAQRKRRGLRIVPILLSACNWEADAHVKDLQVLPRDHQPIASKKNREEALKQVCDEIVTLVRMASTSKQEPNPTPASPRTSVAPADMHTSPQDPPTQARSVNWHDPGDVLRAAFETVPVMKYALAVAGLAAVVAIVTQWFGLKPATAVVGALIVLAIMPIIILLGVAAARSEEFKPQAKVLTWGILLLLLCTLALLMLSSFFKWPRSLPCVFYDTQCENFKTGPVSNENLRTNLNSKVDLGAIIGYPEPPIIALRMDMGAVEPKANGKWLPFPNKEKIVSTDQYFGAYNFFYCGQPKPCHMLIYSDRGKSDHVTEATVKYNLPDDSTPQEARLTVEATMGDPRENDRVQTIDCKIKLVINDRHPAILLPIDGIPRGKFDDNRDHFINFESITYRLSRVSDLFQPGMNEITYSLKCGSTSEWIVIKQTVLEVRL